MRRTICGLSFGPRLCCTTSKSQLISRAHSIPLSRKVILQLRQHCNQARLFSSCAVQNTTHGELDALGQVDSLSEAGTETNNEAELRARAADYGIDDLNQLRLGNVREGSRLFDDVRYQSDFGFWKLALDYQAHYHGIVGTRLFWHEFRLAVRRLKLPFYDETADELWQNLLHTAIVHRDNKLLKRLYAKDSPALQRDKIVTEVVSALLRAHWYEEIPVAWHTLSEKHYDRIAMLLDIWNLHQPKNERSIDLFFRVYDLGPPTKIYASIVNQSCQQHRLKDALHAHQKLVERGDYPLSFEEIRPLLLEMAKHGKDSAPVFRQLRKAGISLAGHARQISDTLRHNPELSNITQESSLSSTRNRVSDSFAAKAFSTAALPFEFVLNSLAAFGMTQIGPQTIREVGLVAKNRDTLAQRLSKFDERGIDTGASVYSRIVRKLCDADEELMLRQVLDTDIHHDVFEDSALQQRLLKNSLMRCDWPRVNLLLVIINQGNVSTLNHTAQSSLLSATFSNISQDENRAFLGLTQAPDSLFRHGGNLALSQAMRLFSQGQTRMQHQGATKREMLDRARFTAGVLQDAIMSETNPSPVALRGVLLRLGSLGPPAEVLGLIYWLAHRYSPENQQFDTHVPESSNPSSSRSKKWVNADTLFDEKFQAALIHWTLKHALKPVPDTGRSTWLAALRLLKWLEDNKSIHINLTTIVRIIVMRSRYLHTRIWKPTSKAPILAGQRPTQILLSILKDFHQTWDIPLETRRKHVAHAIDSLHARRKMRFRPSTFASRIKDWSESRGWKLLHRNQLPRNRAATSHA